jgi:hypothetical protein
MSLSFPNRTVVQMIAYLQKLKQELKQNKKQNKKKGKHKRTVRKAAHRNR